MISVPKFKTTTKKRTVHINDARGKTSRGRGEMRWNACLIRGRQLSPPHAVEYNQYWNRNLWAVPRTALGWLQVSLPSTPQSWLICFLPLPSHKSSCINYLQWTQFSPPPQSVFIYVYDWCKGMEMSCRPFASCVWLLIRSGLVGRGWRYSKVVCFLLTDRTAIGEINKR